MSDRETEEWSLQAEMDLRDAEASDAYREFVNDHVRFVDAITPRGI